MSGSRRRSNKGSWLQLIILRVLYEEPAHGYKLLEKVNELMAGRRALKSGSMYTILRRMERSGILESEWEATQGSRRRNYRLTDVGVEVLEHGKVRVEEQRRVLEEMTRFYQEQFKGDQDG